MLTIAGILSLGPGRLLVHPTSSPHRPLQAPVTWAGVVLTQRFALIMIFCSYKSYTMSILLLNRHQMKRCLPLSLQLLNGKYLLMNDIPLPFT